MLSVTAISSLSAISPFRSTYTSSTQVHSKKINQKNISNFYITLQKNQKFSIYIRILICSRTLHYRLGLYVYSLLLVTSSILLWPSISISSQLSITPYSFNKKGSSYILTEVDYLDEKNNPVLIRQFNNKNTNWDIGLGPGWLTNFHKRILSKNSQQIKLLNSNGMVLTFSVASNGIRWDHPDQGYIILDNGRIIWRNKDDRTYVFNGPYLIKIIEDNYDGISLNYENGILSEVNFTNISNDKQDSSHEKTISFRYNSTSRLSNTYPTIESISFDTGEILEYGYNNFGLKTATFNDKNIQNTKISALWSSEYTYVNVESYPYPLLQKVRSNHVNKTDFDISYRDKYEEFKIWDYQKKKRTLHYNSLDEKNEVTNLVRDNISTQRITKTNTTVMERALQKTFLEQSGSNILELEAESKTTLEPDNVHQFYTVEQSRASCSNCEPNVFVIAIDSSGHMTGLAYDGQATSWKNTSISSHQIYYTTTYNEYPTIGIQSSRHSIDARPSEHTSTPVNQQSVIVEAKIINRDSGERPRSIEFNHIGTVQIDYSPDSANKSLKAVRSTDYSYQWPGNDSILISHESINEIILTKNQNINKYQSSRLNDIPDRRARVGLAGEESKRILAIESFRRSHDASSCQVATSEPSIFGELESDQSGSTDLGSNDDNYNEEECEGSESPSNSREETFNTLFTSLTNAVTDSLDNTVSDSTESILSDSLGNEFSDPLTINGISTQFLDIRPENCQSFFQIPNGIQRGNLIENAVAQSDRYSSALSTVRWFPSVDFIQDRTAIVQASRDLTATTYTERPDRLYNILVREAELINTRFLEPLSLNGYVSAIDGNQSTTIRQNDIDQIQMEIIIQHGVATDEQLAQISRAALEIMNVHGIQLQIIEIP